MARLLFICLKIGCPTNFISVFLFMLYLFLDKTKFQHRGKSYVSTPFLYFSRAGFSGEKRAF